VKKYDLIVIGTGSTGSSVAYTCRTSGWKVAIIDSRPFGGTCALRGCDPKKILVGAAEIINRSIDLKSRGIKKEPKINWRDLMNFKNSLIKSTPKNNEKAYKRAGIDSYHGQAVFTGKNILKIGKQEIEGKYIVIATGAKPRKLNISGEKFVTLSDEFLETKKLPKDIIFIGGGYVTFELAHVAACAGAKVKILHRSKDVLKNFDKDLVNILLKEFKEIGIEVILNTPAKSIEKKGKELIVHSRKKKFKAHMVVHGAGRVPDIEDLNLEKAWVKYNEKGVIVNDYLQTSNPKIYSGGDSAASGMPLTPVAGLHGKVIAENLLKKNSTKVNHKITASVVFTYPPLASVGLREEEAKKKGIKYEKRFVDTSSWYNSRRIGLKYSGYKILTDKKGHIIGVHLLYPNADDVINMFVLAIENKLKTEDFIDYLFSYPSNSYDIKYMI